MEGLRAYAAMLIFFVHYFDAYFREYLGQDPNKLDVTSNDSLSFKVFYYLFNSHFGVDIFFFLSGFLIFLMVSKDGFRYWPFLLRRLRRIYPAAFIAICFWAWIRTGVQKWYEFDHLDFLGNLIFLNAVPSLGIRAFNVVTWSLFYEVVFYITFPILFLLLNRLVKISALSVIIVGALYFFLGQSIVAFPMRFIMFAGGALLAVLSKRHEDKRKMFLPDVVVLLIFIGSTIIFTLDPHQYDFFIPIFVITTFLLAWNVLFGRGFLYRFFSFWPLRWLGNISYSFYLMHILGVQIVIYMFPLFADLDKPVFIVVTFLLSFAISVVVATLLFIVAERPYFRGKRLEAGSAKISD
jgi:peptidoglycan/LPS O-acetylase OafA/YrhL